MTGVTASEGRRSLRVLLRYDLHHALASPRGVLFLVFFGMFWAWVLWKLAGGKAEMLAKDEASFVASMFFDQGLIRLFRERSPTLTGFFFVALTVTPAFAMLGGCDQTASDIASKHLRFLIPRTGRAQIFLARFTGAVILVSSAQLAATLAATLVAAGTDSTETALVLLYGVRVGASLVLYSIPFVALMALLSASIASPVVAALSGIGGYLVLVAGVGMLKARTEAAEYVLYVVPGGLKAHLLQPELGPTLLAAAATFAYTAVYLFLGWHVFRSRDA